MREFSIMKQPNTSTRILVTGSRGFIGQHLVAELARRGFNNVIATSKNPASTLATDLTDLGATKILMATFHPEIIIHLAGNPNTKLDIKNPNQIIQDNVVATHNLLLAAPHGCRFVFASSVVVYGDGDIRLESDVLQPKSVYASTKVMCENLLNSYYYQKDMQVVSLRLCATVGPNATHGVVPDLIRKIDSKSEYLELIGDEPGSCKPYLYINDVVDGLIYFAISPISDDLFNLQINLSNSDNINISKIADILMEQFGKIKPKKWLGESVNWAGDNKVLRVGNNLARYYGWQPLFGSSALAVKQAAYDIYYDMFR